MVPQINLRGAHILHDNYCLLELSPKRSGGEMDVHETSAFNYSILAHSFPKHNLQMRWCNSQTFLRVNLVWCLVRSNFNCTVYVAMTIAFHLSSDFRLFDHDLIKLTGRGQPQGQWQLLLIANWSDVMLFLAHAPSPPPPTPPHPLLFYTRTPFPTAFFWWKYFLPCC